MNVWSPKLLEDAYVMGGDRNIVAAVTHDEKKHHFLQLVPREMLDKLDVPIEGLEESIPAE